MTNELFVRARFTSSLVDPPCHMNTSASDIGAPALGLAAKTRTVTLKTCCDTTPETQWRQLVGDECSKETLRNACA